MANGDNCSDVPEYWVVKYRNHARIFWTAEVRHICRDFTERARSQMENTMREFKGEIYAIVGAIDMACGNEDRDPVRAEVEAIAVDIYKPFSACAMQLQSPSLSNSQVVGGIQKAPQPEPFAGSDSHGTEDDGDGPALSAQTVSTLRAVAFPPPLNPGRSQTKRLVEDPPSPIARSKKANLNANPSGSETGEN
jgi:hypothetical protein